MQWLQDTFTAFSTTESNTDTTDNKHAEIPESGTLQRDGKLSSRQLLDFFRTASEIMQSEEFRRKLKDARLLKQDIEDMITAMQKEVLENQDIDGSFGISFLGKVSTEYKSDNAVMAELLKFASLEEDTLDEVELSEAEYEQKKRLLNLAKAHTAQLMGKMDQLPPHERQAFLQSQIKVAEQLRENIAAGNARSDPKTHVQSPLIDEPASSSSMSPEEMMRFFKAQRS